MCGSFDADGSTPFSPVESCPKSGDTSTGLTDDNGCDFDVDKHNEEQAMLKEFYNFLDADLTIWLNYLHNKDFKVTIEDYLKFNMGLKSLHSFAFAKEAIKAKKEDGRNEIDFADKIINKLTGRSKEAYKILKASDPFFVKNLIQNNFESEKEALLILKMGDLSHLGSDLPGFADLQYNAAESKVRIHNIIIDPIRIEEMTNIEIAQVIIHEMLHAELMERSIQLGLFTKVDAVRNIFEPLPNNIPPGLNQLNDLIFAYMIDNYRSTPSTATDWNHNAFSIENYRGRIVDALLSVHPFMTDPNPSSSFPPSTLINMTLREIFEDFSWNGLKETAEYLALDQSVKNRIEFVTAEINRTYSRIL